MAGMDNSAARVTTVKAPWRSPKLQELGNLRSFVQSGHAFGKSGTIADGCSDPAWRKNGHGRVHVGSPVALWTEPRIEWHRGTDSLRHYQYLVNGAELLTRWEPAPFEFSPTDCFKLGDAFWIWQPGVGGIQFNAAEPAVNAFPSDTVDSAWFEHLIERSWMPAVYQAWGRQVLHASAVAEKGSGRVLAFTGPSGAGKSTMAYGLGQRPGWTHVADDTLAFSVDAGTINLHPLKNDARLRPATAAYHGRSDAPFQPIAWPSHALSLSKLFVIAGDDEHDVRRGRRAAHGGRELHAAPPAGACIHVASACVQPAAHA